MKCNKVKECLRVDVVTSSEETKRTETWKGVETLDMKIPMKNFYLDRYVKGTRIWGRNKKESTPTASPGKC